jgi:iron complex outermembrane recepter protein
MNKSILLGSAATGLMLFAAPAYADQAATEPQTTNASADAGTGAATADTGTSDDAIIVTARRRAEDVSKVPIAITAFSGAQLVAKGVTSVFELTKITPGLNISAGGGKANPFIVIRGQSKAVTGNGSPGVITYLNDVPLPGYGSAIQTYDMENVQVLKGPQGTLFGRNSVGGALLTVTKGPTYDFGGYASAEFATHDYQQLEGAINVPIVNDHVALRLAAQVGHDGGDVKTYLYSQYNIRQVAPTTDNPFGFAATPGDLVPSRHNADEYSNQSYRASLLIEPTDWIKNVTVGDYSKIRGQNNQTFATAFPGGFFGLPSQALYFKTPADAIAALGGNSSDPQTAGFARTYVNGILVPLTQCPQGTVNCNMNAAIAAAQNSTLGRYNYMTQDPYDARTIIKGITNTTTIRLGENHQLKNIFAIRTTDSFSDTTLTGLAIPTITSNAVTRLKQTTEELQLSGSFFQNDLKYTLGGFLYNEKPNGLGGYQALEVNAFMGLSHVLSTTYLHNSSKAVYGQFDYSLDKLISGLTITAGARQTWDEQSACTTNTTFSPFGPARAITSAQDGSAIPTEAACLAGTGANVSSPQVFPAAKFNKLTYTLGANWQINSDAMVYVVHRRGYRAGGYNTPTVDPYLGGLQTFSPETLTDWEIGTKLRFEVAGMRGSLDVAAFSGTSENNQIPVASSQLSGGSAPCVANAVLGSFAGGSRAACTLAAPVTFNGTTYGAGTAGGQVPINAQTVTVNAAKLLIRGVEAAGSISPIEGLTIGGSLAYVDITTKGLSYDPALQAVFAFAGRTLPQSVNVQGQAAWSTNVNVSAELPEKVLGGTLSASADYHYNGAYRSVDIIVPSWQQIDARVTLEGVGGTGISLSAYVKNLTNETTYLGSGSSQPGGVGTSSYVLGRSRTFGLLTTYKF